MPWLGNALGRLPAKESVWLQRKRYHAQLAQFLTSSLLVSVLGLKMLDEQNGENRRREEGGEEASERKGVFSVLFTETPDFPSRLFNRPIACMYAARVECCLAKAIIDIKF